MASAARYEGEMRTTLLCLQKIPRVIYRICPSEFNTALSASVKFYSWLIRMYWDIFAYWQNHFLSDTHRNDVPHMNVYVDSREQITRGFLIT